MAPEKNPPERHQRPISPFMIGPYYKPQLSSILSIAHRASGVFLSVFGSSLLIYWLVSLSQGPAAYHEAMLWLASTPGMLLLSALCFAIYYHFFNGLRHLIWDTGKMMKIEQANRSAIFILSCSFIASALTIATVGGWL
ncbi:MAG: succinate dehydrogenase, cytochrome b556 subunit [Xanthomonadales bacterium]|nr:succinate dehydrogenase, cytochrome b556 subunit [Xanthomonadales bacterium]